MELIPKGWGSRLRAERKRLGRTQADVANLVGISTVTYQQYEREEHEPKLTFLNKLKELGFDARLIFFGEVNEVKVFPIRAEQLEIRAFNLAEEYIVKTYNGILGSEAKYALFAFFRSHLEALVLSGVEMPAGLETFYENAFFVGGQHFSGLASAG